VKRIVAIIVAVVAILTTASTAFAGDGDLDTSWGGTGVVISSHTYPSLAYALANYLDNRVLVIGSVIDSLLSRILVQRFLADGSPDTSCNGTGQFIDSANDAVASDVVVLSDGSFIVAGTMQINNKGTLFLAKFTSSCEVDGSFGNGGFAKYPSDNSTAGTALAVQSNGSIIVVGYEYLTVLDSSDQRILVTRFSSMGVLDVSFGNSGRFISSSNEEGRAQDVVLDDDGRIIFVGSIVGNLAPSAAIVGRLTNMGSLDTSFATQGYLIDEFNGDPELNAIAVRPNGNLVAVGTYGGPAPSLQQSPIVVCLTQSGAFDTACGPQGWKYLPASNRDIFGDDVFVTADNHILISGMSDAGSPAPIVMRLDDTGAVDSDFATSGTWNGSPLSGRLHAVSAQSDGRIIAAGAIDDQGVSNLAVVRLGNTVTPPTTTTTVATTTIPPALTTTTVAASPATTTTPPALTTTVATSLATTTVTNSISTTTTTTMTIATTTISPDQLPATGQQVNVLTIPIALFGLGILLLGMRRRALR
jgi:uncharacterized delta-60 repeat protein